MKSDHYWLVSAKEIVMFAGEVLVYVKLFIFDDVYIDRSVLLEYNELNFEKNYYEEMNIKTMPIDALPWAKN